MLFRVKIEEWRVEMDYDEIRALKQDIMASMHCALPGTIN